MMMKRLWPVAALLLAAACRDGLPSSPASAFAPGASPHGVVTVANVPGQNWQDIQNALNGPDSVVHIPAGDWTLPQHLTVPSNKRIYGDGPGQTRIAPVDSAAFRLEPGTHDVTVEQMSITGNGMRKQSVIEVLSSDHVTLQHVSVDMMGLLRTDLLNSANPQQYTDATISHDVNVLNNTGVGPCGRGVTCVSGAVTDGERNGVYLMFVHGAHVYANNVRNYSEGIYWAGYGTHDSIRAARDLLIENDTVTYTMNGIWGSDGANVTVQYSEVNNCADVCLDAESSDSVLFYSNNARWACGATLAAFDADHYVRHVWNRAEQNGGCVDANNASRTGNALLLRLKNSSFPGVDVLVYNNTLVWTPSTGHGWVQKEQSAHFVFDNNVLQNVNVDLLSTTHEGAVEMQGNQITFDRYLDDLAPAIKVGYSRLGDTTAATPVNAQYQLVVAGNNISSTWRQDGAGITVYQPASPTNINTWLYTNTIRDFLGGSIVVQNNSRPTLIQQNSYSSTLTPSASGGGVTLTGNTKVGNTYTNSTGTGGGTGCGSQFIC